MQRRHWVDPAADPMEELDDFDRRLGGFTGRVDGLMVRVAALSLALLVVVQAFHGSPLVRRWVTMTDPLEGSWSLGPTAQQALPGLGPARVAGVSVSAVSGRVLTVYVTSASRVPGVRLLVDGQAVGSFAGGFVSVPVLPGQRVAVDGTGSKGEYTFRVTGAAGLVSPAWGTQVTVRGNVASLGTVAFDESQ